MPLPLAWQTLTVTDTKVTVGAASTLVVAANPRRTDLVLVNDSDEVIYLARGNAAVMNQGIRLNAAGGSYEINCDNIYLGAIYAICTSGSKNLTVSEGIR